MNKTHYVKIYSIWSKRYATAATIKYGVMVQAPVEATDEQLLSAAFQITNQDARPLRQQVCSTSCGDVMSVRGNYYLVEMVGFKAISPDEAEKIQKLTSRDTGCGYDWLKKNNLI